MLLGALPGPEKLDVCESCKTRDLCIPSNATEPWTNAVTQLEFLSTTALCSRQYTEHIGYSTCSIQEGCFRNEFLRTYLNTLRVLLSQSISLSLS